MSPALRIGIDLGGTKIEIAALSPDGDIVLRRRIPAPQGDYLATIHAVSGLVGEVEHGLGALGTVGIGIPGTVSPASGLVKNANSVWLNGKPLDRDLEAALGRPIRIANDANCFALSEAIDGAARGYRAVFGVILGTGVGGGVVIDRTVLTGPHAIAGEWGHTALPYCAQDEAGGAVCFCGKAQCIELFLSGGGLLRDYRKLGGEASSSVEVPRLAASGDLYADHALDRYCDRLTRGLSTVINILDPDAIVLGGGLSNIDRLYTQVPRLLPAYVFSDVCTTPVLKNVHGDSSGVRGAAWLWEMPA